MFGRFDITLICVSIYLTLVLYTRKQRLTQGKVSKINLLYECNTHFTSLCSNTNYYKNSEQYITPYAQTEKIFNINCSLYELENMKWCNIPNICVSGDFGTYFPHNYSNEEKTNLSKLFAGTQATHAKFDLPFILDQNVLHLSGKTWLVNCGWRWPSPHPNHFMIGAGTILSHLLGSAELPHNIVMQACSNPFMTNFFRVVFSIVLEMTNKNVNLFVLPGEKTRKSFGKIICIKNAIIQPDDYKTPLGKMAPYVISKFREKIAEKLRLPLSSKNTLKDRCISQRLNIGIHYRSGPGMRNRLRRFTNMIDLMKKIKRISPNVFLFTTNSSTPIRTQILRYNSYDILISPHTSSNVNALFRTQNKSASIEVVHKLFNKHWTWISDKHIISEGHNYSCQSYTINCNITVNIDKIYNEVIELQDFLC